MADELAPGDPQQPSDADSLFAQWTSDRPRLDQPLPDPPAPLPWTPAPQRRVDNSPFPPPLTTTHSRYQPPPQDSPFAPRGIEQRADGAGQSMSASDPTRRRIYEPSATPTPDPVELADKPSANATPDEPWEWSHEAKRTKPNDAEPDRTEPNRAEPEERTKRRLNAQIVAWVAAIVFAVAGVAVLLWSAPWSSEAPDAADEHATYEPDAGDLPSNESPDGAESNDPPNVVSAEQHETCLNALVIDTLDVRIEGDAQVMLVEFANGCELTLRLDDPAFAFTWKSATCPEERVYDFSTHPVIIAPSAAHTVELRAPASTCGNATGELKWWGTVTFDAAPAPTSGPAIVEGVIR